MVTRIILEDKTSIVSLVELIKHIEGQGEFRLIKNKGNEASLVRVK